MNVALIFDYDDTLVQTRECKFSAIQALGSRSYERSLSSADIEAHWGKPYRQFFGDLFRLSGAPLDDLIRKYELLSEEFPMRLHLDAQRMINDFLPSHYCGIVSSASARRVSSQLQGLGVPGNRFRFIQGEEHTTVHKPNPRVFDPAVASIKKYHTVQVEIIYIGDSYTDYCAALGASLRFIGIPRTERSRKQLGAVRAQVLESLDALQSAI
jgi:phosphoglycolate phosphatase-like HAD superfamily hydrolase